MEHGERPICGAREPTPRLRRHVDALHPEAEQCWVLPREAAKGEPGLDEIGHRIVRWWSCCDCGPEEIKGPLAKGYDQPLLGAEEAVDGPRSRPDLVRHTAHR